MISSLRHRDEHIRRYAELIAAKNAQACTFARVGAGAGNKSIAGIIAADTGLDKRRERTVRRVITLPPWAMFGLIIGRIRPRAQNNA